MPPPWTCPKASEYFLQEDSAHPEAKQLQQLEAKHLVMPHLHQLMGQVCLLGSSLGRCRLGKFFEAVAGTFSVSGVSLQFSSRRASILLRKAL